MSGAITMMGETRGPRIPPQYKEHGWRARWNAWKRRLLCDTMGWHAVDNVNGFDGASFHGRCSRCDKLVMMDSQGNWF